MVEKRRELWGCFMCGWSLQQSSVALRRQEGLDPCSAGESLSPSRVQVV